MLREERGILWRTSAVTLGLALPAIMLGNGLMYGLLLLGILTGLLATKDMSLRATVGMILSSRLVLLCAGLLVALLVSSLSGINPAYSLHKTSQVAGLMIGALLLFMVLREMPGRYTAQMQSALVVGTLAMLALAWADSFVQSARLSGALHGVDKALTPHRLNFHSTAFAVISPFIWAFYVRRMREKEPMVKMSAPVVLPLLVATVFMCGGRAGMVGLLAALLVFVSLGSYRFNFNIHARHWLAAAGSIGLGVVAYAASRDGLSSLAERLEIAQGARGLGGGRGDIWQTALNHLWDQPITGIGPNAFRFLPENIDFHPHNALLQVVLETGLVGTVFVVGIGLFILRLFYCYARGNVFGLGALAAFVAYGSSAMFNKSIFDMEWLTMLVLVLSLGWRWGWSSGQKPAGEMLNAGSFLTEMQQGKK